MAEVEEAPERLEALAQATEPAQESLLADEETLHEEETHSGIHTDFVDLLGLHEPETVVGSEAAELDPLDAEWAELLGDPVPPLPAPLVSAPPLVPADDSPAFPLSPVIESDEDEQPSEQVAVASLVEAAPPDTPLRLTCNVLFEIDDEVPESASSDVETPLLPPTPATPKLLPVEMTGPRRRGGPPVAVLMERMTVQTS